MEYKNREELISEVLKFGNLFIEEFNEVKEEDKDKLVEDIDRTPREMIAYQLGWMKLILAWEEKEQRGEKVITPSPDYKWNKLGGLYKSFYKEYEGYTLLELKIKFKETEDEIIKLINSYTEEELFLQGGRKWSSSTASNWPIWKWIHINTVAPFKSFRTKIRKWKKMIKNKLPKDF